MMKIAQAESVGAVHTHSLTHTDSSLLKSVVINNSTFIYSARNLSMCNKVNYNIII